MSFFNHNLKKGDPILIIFGVNVPDATGHQITIYFPTSPNACFCTTWGKRTNEILHCYPTHYYYL